MSDFYTYLWLREDGTPYYAGKGSTDRAFEEHRFCGPPPPIERIIIQPHTSENAAFAAEKFLIAYYGRKDIGTGILCNMTDGGEGFGGVRRSKESYVKAGAKMRGALNPNFGKTMPQEQRDAISASRKGKNCGKRLASVGEKISAIRKAKIASGEIKMPEGGKTYWCGKTQSDESNRKRSVTLAGKCVGELNSMFGRTASEETRAKMSASQKARGNKPPSWLGRKHTPESIAKICATKAAQRLAKAEALNGLA